MKKFIITFVTLFLFSTPSFTKSSSTTKSLSQIQMGNYIFSSKPVELTGSVLNLTVNRSARVSMRITYLKGEVRAIGSYDNKNLFGKFNVLGEVIYLSEGKEPSSLQFEGDLLLGNDGSGFPPGMKGHYVMTLSFNPSLIRGVYEVSNLAPYMPINQYGILDLEVIAPKK